MQLRQLAGSRAPGTHDIKREAFKKVISYMAIGIDVSSVFSEMVMCSANSDIVLKKMYHLYVRNYAKHNLDLALLTINFLQRDCKDENPMIHGLALRSLCSFGLANLVEYLVGPLFTPVLFLIYSLDIKCDCSYKASTIYHIYSLSLPRWGMEDKCGAS